MSISRADTDKEFLQTLGNMPWPNNISDLVWVMEHALRQCRGRTIRREHLPKDMGVLPVARKHPTLDETVGQAQRNAIENALNQTDGNIPQAAKLLDRHKRNLCKLMKELGMDSWIHRQRN
jgi:DNA-binding NtrC family response regulator